MIARLIWARWWKIGQIGADFALKVDKKWTRNSGHDRDQNREMASVRRSSPRQKNIPFCRSAGLHFLNLQIDTRAQAEIRQYAVVIGKIVSKWVPIVWEAFMDFRRHGMLLSRIEQEIIRELVSGGSPDRARVIAEANGWLRIGKNGILLRNREREELEMKLRDFGLAVP